MSNPEKDARTSSDQPSLQAELQAIPEEPLLPVEKRLIAGSLILGLMLLGLLLWISANYFPVIPTGKG